MSLAGFSSRSAWCCSALRASQGSSSWSWRASALCCPGSARLELTKDRYVDRSADNLRQFERNRTLVTRMEKSHPNCPKPGVANLPHPARQPNGHLEIRKRTFQSSFVG